MELREAYLAMIDLFERRPGSYDFHRTTVPETEGDCGCIVGHAARLMKKEWGGYGSTPVLDVTDATFYIRMDALETQFKGEDPEVAISKQYGRRINGSDWTCNAAFCAELLRQYVEKYHPVRGGAYGG